MYSKILLPIDHTDSASWEKALPLALEEAKSHGAELSVVSVIPEILRLPNLPENYSRVLRRMSKARSKPSLATRFP